MRFSKKIADGETQKKGLHQQEADEESVEDCVEFVST